MSLQLVDELINRFKNESSKFKDDQRAPHLRSFYYRVLLTTRPFGLALCKTFDEKYLCVVLPESPSGQLGIYIYPNQISLHTYTKTHTQHIT